MSRPAVLVRLLTVGAVAVVVVLLVAAAVVVTVVRGPLPDRGAELDLAGLDAEVQVLWDEHGVPQIYADTVDDLFRAQGYVHALDRFFEMDYRRHVTAGRLSELVGPSDGALAADIAVRTMGWRRVAQRELAILSPATRQYLQAYADGVNAYLADRSPGDISIAYTLLDATVDLPRIERWSPVDSLSWLKAVAWDLRSNYADEIGRSQVFGATGDINRAAQLWPGYPAERHAPIVQTGGATSATSGSSVAGALRAQGLAAPAPSVSPAPMPGLPAVDRADELLDAVPDLLGAGEGTGSNSWVISGEHTTTGAPLLANDPHLAPSQPGALYQVGLHCNEPGQSCPFDVAGYSFSGLPGVVIGHNADIAWGVTTMYADTTDLYLERTTDSTYERDGQQVPLEERTETIEVAGGEAVTITVQSTVHGPVLSDAIDFLDDVGRSAPAAQDAPPRGFGYDVALAWTALTPGRTADALFAINLAEDFDSFREAAALFEVPAQNLVYADTQGHIGYQAPGRIPLRGTGDGTWPVPADGSWPLPGWLSSYDWTGTIPFDDLPSVLDPPEGFVVASNQAVVAPGTVPRLTDDWDYGYRSQRVRELIAGRIERGQLVDMTAMTSIQNDVRNGFAPTLVPYLLVADLGDSQQGRFVIEAQDLLRDWDFSQPPDSAPAAYYNAVWAALLDLTFDDELSQGSRPDGGSRWFEAVRGLLEAPDDPWWDDRRTPGIRESRDEIIRQALTEARLDLTRNLGKDVDSWEWGRLHALTLRQSPIGLDGAAPDVVQELMNVGPGQVGGGGGLVNATSWRASDDSFEVTAAPAMRMVVDLGDLDASRWVNLSGNSGHPWSGHYGDQHEDWLAGRTLPWLWSREAVDERARDRMALRPATG